jgi:hypothetical protein
MSALVATKDSTSVAAKLYSVTEHVEWSMHSDPEIPLYRKSRTESIGSHASLS